jgi:hypothetical protein
MFRAEAWSLHFPPARFHHLTKQRLGNSGGLQLKADEQIAQPATATPLCSNAKCVGFGQESLVRAGDDDPELNKCWCGPRRT